MIQEDTFPGWRSDPLSLNRYTYAHNNPIKYYDPTGHYVSPTDKANLTASQIKGIEKATSDWNAANARGDTAGMVAANAAANVIRASAGYSGGGNGNSIVISSGNTTKTVVINDTTTVNNSGIITTVNILAGANSSITNSGTIRTVSNSGTINNIYNSGTIGNIYNTSSGKIKSISNSGSIGTITNSGSIVIISNNGTITNISNINNGSIGIIGNSNTIGNINTGKSTTTLINNTDDISSITTGSNSIVGVNDTGTINSIILGLGSVKLTNVKNDINIPLGSGWSYRFEVGDPNNPGNSNHMHLFQTNGKQSYSQNEDGSLKDKPKGGSGSSKSVMKKLKEQTGWDWDAKDKDWLNKIEMSASPAGYYFISYPDGRMVTVYKPYTGFSMPYSPSNQNLREHYFEPTYIDLSGGKTNTNPSGPIIVPLPNPIPIPVPAPAPMPVPVFP